MATTTHSPSAPNASRTPPAPLLGVLAITFLGSVGTGAVTNGIYFITDSGLGFGRAQNLMLGVALGVTYVAAALLVGPALRRLAQRSRAITTKRVLVTVLLLMGLVCQLPVLAQRFYAGDTARLAQALWLMVLVYSPMTGVLWPVVESYLSGGRRGAQLRTAIGRFNIVWSSALVAAYWSMAPLVENHPFKILAALGLLHAAMALVALTFTPEPARHLHEDHSACPPSYRPLLALCRSLLFASYFVISALGPLQPIILERIGVPVPRWTLLASVWLIARVAAFALFERWHGWHGRAATAWAGLVLLIIGFALCVGSPALAADSGAAAQITFALGLASCGVSIGIIYTAALYYAMAVGSSEVDAGGKHEAVIGTGYTLGPAIGLLAIALATSQGPSGTTTDDEAFRFWSIALTTAAALLAGFVGWRLGRTRDPKSADRAEDSNP